MNDELRARVELVLERVEAGSRTVVAHGEFSDQEIAHAVSVEAERRGLRIKVELVDGAVAVELDEA
jgi:hypothetical protein